MDLLTLLLSFLSLIAAVAAAYLSWRQLRKQQHRWGVEDSRIKPKVRVLLSGGYSDEGWFHGVWDVTNRAPFEFEVVSIYALSPHSLLIGELDPASDGAVEGMKVRNTDRELVIRRVIPGANPPQYGNISANFLYRVSDSPESDRGLRICLRFQLREVDNPKKCCIQDCEATIPLHKLGI